MGGIDGQGPQQPLHANPGRAEALAKIRAMRQNLANTSLTPTVKATRDDFIGQHYKPAAGGGDVENYPMPIPVSPKYGLATVPDDFTQGFEPKPILMSPKYGVSPVPRPQFDDAEPIRVSPKYGMATIPDDDPRPIEAAPKYGVSPAPDWQPEPMPKPRPGLLK